MRTPGFSPKFPNLRLTARQANKKPIVLWDDGRFFVLLGSLLLF
jgi:hypothetical protein